MKEIEKQELPSFEKEVISMIKKTVGYHESTNKDELINGAKIAYHKTMDVIESEFIRLKNSNQWLKKHNDEVITEITSIATIIKKYTSE